ncbi:hypothetical protein KRX52_05065 [Pseudomonas sp. MAP12]|uniref:Uncharacterized protein n=1 Tax=Geopseudomonas aromaticivorans TaxID=2849492 RepID=A0ABS6MV88_9GAMM|nr:hypothetical protein [Pseudomonas aromaticivorans]MBV2132167.1 hypothetical protein [Pseudomonas aromaticivorans]
MKWKLDIQKINSSCLRIIGNLKEESLATYYFINDQWSNGGSVVDNKLFQFVFRSFYRIDNAGLTDEFKNRYFALMEETRSKAPNLREICETLHGIENAKGSKSLQFSFATKLANTINPLLPIYDSEVAKMYGYKPPLPYKPLSDRITNLLQFHEHLACDYSKIISDGLLNPTIDAFDRNFPNYTGKIGKRKKLDFIIWSAGKLRDK